MSSTLEKLEAEFLRRVEIFSLLDPEEVGSLAAHLRPVTFEAGSCIFHEKDTGEEMFIVREGLVAGSVDLTGSRRREVGRFAPGDFFGEMAIFENAPRSATCQAIEPSLLLALSSAAFFGLVEREPELAIKVMFRMLNVTTRRLKEKSQLLSDMVLWGEKAMRRTITDELTGAYNRRFLEDALQDHYERACRQKEPLTLVMADLDFFRVINERIGPAGGDRVLVQVVNIMRECLRASDLIARYGGDEFLIVLPATALEEALDLAERIRVSVQERTAAAGPAEATALSLGVADFPHSAQSLDDLWKAADRAMYEAKTGGRNRTVPARPPAAAPHPSREAVS